MRHSSPDLADGPKTAKEVFAWPRDILSRILDSDTMLGQQAAARFHANFQNVRIQYSSDYSGLDCPQEALRLLVMAFARRISDPTMAAKVCVLRACDSGAKQQEVLMALSTDVHAGQTCLFQDVESRLPNTVVAELDNMEPATRAPQQEKRRARELQHEYLMGMLDKEMFTPRTTAYCVVHNQQCLTLPDPPLVGTVKLPDAPPTATRKFRLHVAGTCCQGWSGEGTQERFAHRSERTHSVWFAERKYAALAGLEDGFIQECTVRYPWVVKLKNPLADTHEVRRLVVNPSTLGFPSNRLRSWVIAVSKKTMMWQGGDDDQVQSQFDQLFLRKLSCTGDVYLNASAADITQEHRRLAGVQRNFLAPDIDVPGALAKDPSMLEVCMPLGMCHKYHQWQKYREQHDPSGGPFFADLAHNVHGKAPAPGKVFPTELSHNMLAALHRNRFVLKLETMSSHGFMMHEAVCEEFGVSPMKKILMQCCDKPYKLARLSGNGMDLPSAACVICFLFGFVEPCTSTTAGSRSLRELRFGRKGATQFFEADVLDEEKEEGSVSTGQTTSCSGASVAGKSSI